MSQLRCEICKGQFTVRKYREKTARFCSKSCKYRWDSERMKGNNFADGHEPWNKGLKGIHLSPETEFKKGSVPWNKDVKGLHHSPETEFKKGRVAEHRLPVGSVTERTDKQGKQRFWVKIEEPNVWMPRARYVWEQKNGKIPEGLIIHHIDENPSNDDISNLAMLTKAEHAMIHATVK